MKIIFDTSLILCSIAMLASCQNNAHNQSTKATNVTQAVKPVAVKDNRPIEELNLLNKAGAEYSNYDDNAAQKDMRKSAFCKYAADSLKKITNWQMIVTGIDDNSYNANSFASAFLSPDANPIYNIQLVAPIKIDKSVDTIAIDNRIEFIYTIPKNPKGANLKAQLATIKDLKNGDTVIVSGSITHIDENLKVNFAPVFEKGMPWSVDLLATDIRKK